ncbi:hypothetical protein [Salinibacterium sp. ZJ454]|uniref:hypothetical protein n=1 Tax=Salinibacterium sp. ZJ454 TaxID=2708339 RepID=UPI0014216E6C|nr:hypothetical protein [Salinibacterium sp. ZJ454]
MDCQGSMVSCQLERIADELTAFDVNGFVATLVATLIGAAVAAAISILLYRHELSVRKRGEIDAAVSELIRAIQVYSQDYRRFLAALNARADQSALAVQSGWAEPIRLPPEPDREALDTAVEMLIVITDGYDRAIAERTRQVLYELNFLRDTDAQRAEFASVRRVLVAWRARKRTAQETLASLDTIDVRRQMIESDIVDRDLPESPEPYVRQSEVRAEPAK